MDSTAVVDPVPRAGLIDLSGTSLADLFGPGISPQLVHAAEQAAEAAEDEDDKKVCAFNSAM